MKTGMLKLTPASQAANKKYGDLWVQCEKVTYVREDFSGDGNRTILGLVGGEEIAVKEAASWLKKQLCPH